MVVIPSYNVQDKTHGTINLTSNIDQKTVKPSLFAVYIRSLFQNWRQGTVASKTRGQVAFSNKKPWRQKGTGRARVSSLRSPLWRKGGIIFGPQKRIRTLSVNKNHKKIVFNNLFFEKINKKSVFCLDAIIDEQTPSTKSVVSFLQDMGIYGKKVLFFLSLENETLFLSCRNITNIGTVLFDQPNAFDLSNADYWLFLKKDFELFKDMVCKWN